MNRRHSILGFFARGLPLVATLLTLSIIGIIVANFLIGGAGHLSWEFLTAMPQNANTEGGILPAIFGTVLLVLIMTVAAVPVGTITAIYLTEYARPTSPIARTIRFAVNTLAGVPSIVFGLFGLGFFIQIVGGSIDHAEWNSHMDDLEQVLEQPASPLAETQRAPMSAVANYLAQVNEDRWEHSEALVLAYPDGDSTVLDRAATMHYLRGKPELDWGKGNILWAALTLALLTLPVVIVSVEESLRAVPRDVREASLALGATRLETIRKIVIPNSITGILTGAVLAISRGAGEVAPILFTGVAYSTQQLPSSLSDQFMHLGYLLYLLSTQSPDIDAARPIAYATALVLLGLTLALNMVAILMRSRIRRRQAA